MDGVKISGLPLLDVLTLDATLVPLVQSSGNKKSNLNNILALVMSQIPDFDFNLYIEQIPEE